VASESGEDDEEEEEEEEDEDEAAAEADNRRRRKLEKVSRSGSGSGSGSEDEDEEDEDEEDEDEEDDEEEEDDEDEDAESETASQMLDGSDASAGARRRRQRRRRQSAKERTGLEAHERAWLKTFAASLDSLAKGGGAAAAAAAAAQRGGKRGGRRFKAPAPKKNAFSPVTLAQVQAGVVPATIAREQLAIEAQHQAQREELSRTPLLEPQSAESDPGAALRAANGGRPPTPRNHAALQSFVHAYILGLRSEEYHTTKRIVEQIRRFKHGEHDEDEDDEEGEDEEEEEEGEDEDAEDEEDEDAESGEEGEDAEEEEDEEANHSGEDPLHKFMRGLHKKNPRAARKERERKRREAKAKAKAEASAGDEDADVTVDAGDITIENVEESMSALALGAPAQGGSAAAAAADSSTSPPPSGADNAGASSSSSGLSFPALVPAVRSAAEAALMSHSQGATSPSLNDAHHAVAHKHAIKHASAGENAAGAGAADNAGAAAQPAQPHLHKHPKHHQKHKHGARKSEQDDEHDADEDEEEDEEGEDEDEERSGYASEHSGSAVTGSHRSGSGSGSGSQRSRTSSTSSWQDALPYEKNLFSLAPSYHFIKRLYSCADAVTYKAYSKLTNKLVAIKICDGYDSSGTVVPKEVRLLNRAQGHPNVCVMNGWHPFPSNGCYAIITEFIENEPIETLFDRPELHKVYMRSDPAVLHGSRLMEPAGVAALSSRCHVFCAPAVLFLAGTCCADCNTCTTEASVHHPSHCQLRNPANACPGQF
jgi:hypothetical protein